MTTAPPSATTTFLFTDIEGSTRRWEESPAMFDQVERHFAALHGAAAAHQGEVFATLGDGIAAAFVSVERAVGAAIEAQLAMADIGVQVRIGIHTGEAQRSGADYRGRAVNRAARIMAAGHGGQILLSDVTASLLRSSPDPPALHDLGPHRLRDLNDPERLWQVIHPQLPSSFPAVRALEPGAAHLPAQRTTFIGRDCDVDHVVAELGHRRIVTLTGVGGVGKTRLAIQVGAELAASGVAVWFVGLAPLSDPDDVVDAVARAIGAASMPTALPSLASALGGRRAVLILDNCEHVIDRVAGVIDALTVDCAELSVLATSRSALDLDGERVVTVAPLDASSALELFEERALAAGADLAVVRRSAVDQLCARLDRLPLAIELAAARSATLGVAAITDSLDRSGALPDPRRRRADGRHATMHSTIQWSYDLLEHDEQQMLRWLSVCSGGFELDTAQAIAATLGLSASSAVGHVESLARRSMLAVEAAVHGVRYRLLETIRAFARVELEQHGEGVAARHALAEWVASVAGLTPDDPCTAAVEQNAVRLEREADNWRDAVVFAAGVGSADLAGALCGPAADFFLLGRSDLADLIRPLLAVGGDELQRGAVLSALIVSASGATDPHELRGWAREVQRIDANHPTGLGGLMRWLTLAWHGDIPASVDVCLEAASDERLPLASRDLFVGIAVLDHFSLTAAPDPRPGLVERALEVAGRTTMALTRVSCLLGAAWSLVDDAPERAVQLVHRALGDMDRLPALTRTTMPGSVARLLGRLDPQVAAQGLLEQLDAAPSRRSFVDLIPVFYGAALLGRLGRSPTSPAVAALTSRPAPSMMDVVDLARDVVGSGDEHSVAELAAGVRNGLATVVTGAAPPG